MTTIEKWLSSLFKELSRDPIRNILILVISLIIVFYMGIALYDAFGLLTVVSYILFCIYGLTRIIRKPERTLIWAVGFMVGAVASNMFFENFIPTIKGGDATSIYSALIILLVIFMFYFKSRELKNT